MKLGHIKSYYTINGLCLFIVCVILTFDLPLVRYTWMGDCYVLADGLNLEGE